MIKSIETISNSSELEIRSCHWCKKQLEGILAEFVHCARCNERRLVEGIDQTYDPCHVCMTLKSKKLDFLNPVNGKNGGILYD